MRINVAKAFNLAADDPEGWKKAVLYAVVVLACSLGTILILPGLFLMLYGPGIMIQYTRNVATGDNHKKVPDPFSAAGLWHGFIALLIYIVYCLPMMGVLVVGLGGAIAGLASGAKMDSAVVSMGSMAGAGLMGVVALFLGLVVASFIPMVTLQYCKNYQFGDAFKIGAIFSGIMSSPLDYLVVLAVPFGLSIVVGMIPFVNLVAGPIVGLVGANLIGQYGAVVLNMLDDSVAPPAVSEPEAETGFSKF